MSKMPIAWHKENLVNTRSHVQRLLKELERAQNNYISAWCSAGKLEAQIIRAESEGKDGFDSEKYGAFKK